MILILRYSSKSHFSHYSDEAKPSCPSLQQYLSIFLSRVAEESIQLLHLLDGPYRDPAIEQISFLSVFGKIAGPNDPLLQNPKPTMLSSNPHSACTTNLFAVVFLHCNLK